MNKNSALSQRFKQIQALPITLLVFRTPHTRTTFLPPVVMTFKKHFIDQTDRTRLNQSRDQIKLSPFNIHLHHHKIILCHCVLQPVSKIKPLYHISRPHNPTTCFRSLDPTHSPPRFHIFVTRSLINLKHQALISHPSRIRQQRDPLFRLVLIMKMLVGLNRVDVKRLVLFRVLFLEPAHNAGPVATSPDINIHVAILKPDIRHRR
ncbi:hypothetical protein HanRHA438_Chr01g0009571 [Helianthus annuus]|uniref:Uncharacterized protein n=1 Tax=Helianthus annuus TaxID=4232 RepID=A0A9K3JSL5_HELAN|nr:hypothetical protein HanXRQr2_Chr01g0009251 [Helianthus annuus]KAJ0946940.1 hypothetical protein HanRHA438_Chr01g0009571 [Helianthus annuus]